MTNITLNGRLRNKNFFFGDASYEEKYNLQGIVGYNTNSKLHFLLLDFTKHMQVCLQFDVREGPLGKGLVPSLTHDLKDSLYRRTRNGAMWPFAATSTIF
jgi:hypothetical protein